MAMAQLCPHKLGPNTASTSQAESTESGRAKPLPLCLHHPGNPCTLAECVQRRAWETLCLRDTPWLGEPSVQPLEVEAGGRVAPRQIRKEFKGTLEGEAG